MNLNEMLEDKSINNLEWLNNVDKNYIPKDKDIDKKDDIIVEWYNNGTIFDVPAPTTIRDEMNINETKSSLELLKNTAYLLMHQGIMGKYLIDELIVLFGKELVKKSSSFLDELLKNEGLVGCAVIDLRYTPNGAGEFIKASNKSPYKRHINYVLMNSDQLDNCNLVEKVILTDSTLNNGNIDGFFAGENDSNVLVYYIYKPLGLKVIECDSHDIVSQRREDLDDEWYDKTLIELATLGDLNEEEIEIIKSDKSPKIQKIRKAFRSAYYKRMRSSKYSSSVLADNKADEYKIDTEFNVELSSCIVKPDINDINVNCANIDVELGIDDNINSVEWVSPNMEEISLQNKPKKEINIESNQFLGKEYFGCDIVDLEDINEDDKKIDIDITGGFNF